MIVFYHAGNTQYVWLKRAQKPGLTQIFDCILATHRSVGVYEVAHRPAASQFRGWIHAVQVLSCLGLFRGFQLIKTYFSDISAI